MQRSRLHHVLLLVTVLGCTGCGSWPPVVENRAEVEGLSDSTGSVCARPLPDADILSLAQLRQLRILNFTDGYGVMRARISDRGLDELASLDLPHLETLTLGYCDNITDAGVSHVARMQSVQYLSLMDCPQVTDAGLSPLLSMKNLTGLDLRGCTGISDKGLEVLKNKKDWETIMLGGCPNVTQGAVTRLQKALPTASVEKDEWEWSHHRCVPYGSDSR